MAMIVASLICGLIFGVGLVVSGMTQPAKVLGFLDVFGNMGPDVSCFVMAGAVAVSALGFALSKRRGAPILAGVSAAQMTHGDRPAADGGRNSVRDRLGHCRTLPRTCTGQSRVFASGGDRVRRGDGGGDGLARLWLAPSDRRQAARSWLAR